jgi:hypothetical protein
LNQPLVGAAQSRVSDAPLPAKVPGYSRIGGASALPQRHHKVEKTWEKIKKPFFPLENCKEFKFFIKSRVFRN